jgi:polar amino acid transport system ATP-binding protein
MSTQSQQPLPQAAAPHVLRAENIRKRFGSKEILRGVGLTLDKGELKVLIGPSGAGKSTFLQCLNFLVVPDEGRIWLEDREYSHARRRELHAYRQQVGMIFQDFNLFDHLSARDNVSVALVKVRGMSRAEARDRAQAELARVGLAEHWSKYPAELSGGQKQRVSIARALAMDPKVMLLDEPTSALDPELIGEVLAVIKDMAAQGMTMIMATHQIGFARSLADEIVFMQDGRIIEQGSPIQLMDKCSSSRTQEFCSKLTELYGD